MSEPVMFKENEELGNYIAKLSQKLDEVMKLKEELDKKVLQLTETLDRLDKKAEEMTSEDIIQVERQESMPPVLQVYSRTRKHHPPCGQRPLSFLAKWEKELGSRSKKTDDSK